MTWLIRSTRSSMLNSPVCLLGLPVTRMVTTSKSAAERLKISRCPKVMGSKERGQTALVMYFPFKNGHVHARDSVGALFEFLPRRVVRRRPGRLRAVDVAFDDHDGIIGQHGRDGDEKLVDVGEIIRRIG